MEKLLTLTEVAQLLGICRNTARKMRLPYVRLHPRGHKLYALTDVNRIIDSRREIPEQIEDIFATFVRTY